MKKRCIGYLMVAPILIGCLIFYVIPFWHVLLYSLTKGYGKSISFVGFEHYEKMLGNDMFLLAFGNTLYFLSIALPSIMVLSYILALILKNNAERYKLIKTVFLLPHIMPVAGTVLLVDILFSYSGLLNKLMFALGYVPSDWVSSQYAFGIVLLLYLWKNTAYSTILLLAGLVTISEEQYEAAKLDGASKWQMFMYITTPQMWYSVFVALVFSLINAFKCFREIFLIGGEHPDTSIYMMQHFINNSFQNLNYPRLAVAAVLFSLIVILFFSFTYISINCFEKYGDKK